MFLIGSVLENGNSMLNSSKSKNDKENQVLRSISLLSHQPFLSLVLSCLKDQDDQRTGLLDSLRGQLEQLYKQVSYKLEKNLSIDNIRNVNIVQHREKIFQIYH
jgi:mediator of RNA polymerase II transcription subunit 12